MIIVDFTIVRSNSKCVICTQILREGGVVNKHYLILWDDGDDDDVNDVDDDDVDDDNNTGIVNGHLLILWDDGDDDDDDVDDNVDDVDDDSNTGVVNGHLLVLWDGGDDDDYDDDDDDIDDDMLMMMMMTVKQVLSTGTSSSCGTPPSCSGSGQYRLTILSQNTFTIKSGFFSLYLNLQESRWIVQQSERNKVGDFYMQQHL